MKSKGKSARARPCKTTSRGQRSIIVLILSFSFYLLTGCGLQINGTPCESSTVLIEMSEETSAAETFETETASMEPDTSEATADTTENEAVQSETANEKTSEAVSAEVPATAEMPATDWINSSKSHDMGMDKVLVMPDGTQAWNMSRETAVTGMGGNYKVAYEADYGFRATIDGDMVLIHCYDNADSGVTCTSISANLPGYVKMLDAGQTDYTISEYADSPDGVGTVEMSMSNGIMFDLAVLKQDGVLYVANVAPKDYDTDFVLKSRDETENMLADEGITPADAIITNGINYPITIRNDGETTDVAPWIAKSSELCSTDWTDGHKVYVLYDWCINNLAYDTWSVTDDHHARAWQYHNFTGKWYISRTHIGTCNDIANVLMIMCRAQGIPAVVCGTEKHAWTAVYMEGRWVEIDATYDTQNKVTTEDVSAWVHNSDGHAFKYYGFPNDKKLENIHVGNPDDQ